MATEVLEIIVREKGARVVARDIAKIAVSAQSANTAVTTLNRTMQTGATASTALSRGASGAAASVGGLAASARASSQALTQAGLGATLLGGAIVKGVAQPLANAVAAASDFQSAINLTGVLAGVERGSAEFERLADTARELGVTTQFTATQAAEGLQFLAKTGFDANEAVAAIPETLRIAAVAGIDLGRASDITTNILRGFRLELEDLPQAVDVLAATVTSSNVDVLQLAETFKAVGPIAAEFGQTFTDVAAVAGALGNAGIQAERAGVALRRIFINLEKDVTKTNSVLREAGIAVRDSEGNFRPLVDIFRDISQSAIAPADRVDLFAARALAAAGVLEDATEEGIRGFIEALESDVGRAAEVAEARLFGLRGEGIQLGSAIEGLQLAIAESGLLDFLTRLTQLATTAFRALARLPEPILAIVAVAATLVSIAGALTLQFGLLSLALGALGIPSITAGFVALGGAIKTAFAFLVATPIGAITAALGLLTVALIQTKDETFQLGDQTVTTSALVAEAWDRLGTTITEVAQGALIEIGELTDGIVEIEDVTDNINFTNFIAAANAAFIGYPRIVLEALRRVGDIVFDFQQGLVRSFLAIPRALELAATGDFAAAGAVIGNSFTSSFENTFEGFGTRAIEIVSEEFNAARAGLRAAGNLLGGTEFVRSAAGRLEGPPTPDRQGGPRVGGSGVDNTDPGLTFAPEVIQRRAEAFNALRASIDPAVEAQLAFLEQVNTINEAQVAGIITQEQANDTLQALAQDGYEAVIANTSELARINRDETQQLEQLQVAAQLAGVSFEQLAAAEARVAEEAERARQRSTEFIRELSIGNQIINSTEIALQDLADRGVQTAGTLQSAFSRAFDTTFDALTDLIVQGELDFKAFAKSILELIRDVIKQLLLQIVLQSIARSVGGAGGAVGSQAGGASAAAASGATFAAEGANISGSQIGSPFIVGEEGPELFVPRTAGRVVPNDELAQMGGGGAGAPAVNVQVVNVDDPDSVPTAMETTRGQEVILNAISRNRRTVRDIVGAA